MGLIKVAEISIDKLEDRKTVTVVTRRRQIRSTTYETSRGAGAVPLYLIKKNWRTFKWLKNL